MMSAQELIEWAQSLNPDDQVGVDDGGLTLRVYGGGNWLEIGGLPLACPNCGREVERGGDLCAVCEQLT